MLIYLLIDNFCVQDMNTIKLLAQLLVPRAKAKVFHELTVSCIAIVVMYKQYNMHYIMCAYSYRFQKLISCRSIKMNYTLL